MLSKILKQNYDQDSYIPNFLYLFEEGNVSEYEFAREIVPLFKKYDIKGNSKLRFLSEINKLSNKVPDIILKPLTSQEGSTIAGISIPNKIHKQFAADLIELGYSFK